MRWLMLGLTILGFALSFVAKGPGLLAIGLLLGFVGLFGLVFSIAADRVSASARPESAMLTPEDLAAMRARRNAGTKGVPPPRPAQAARPPDPGTPG
jgi:hypothetical protein